LGVIDTIIPEPIGGAHRAPDEAIESLSAALNDALNSLSTLDSAALKADRRRKFLAIGAI
jgi:acetyl-CoA carboxylase carboxyl transferase subunit alpha